MSRISTHVLDLVLGKPAANLAVRLQRQTSSGDWHLLASTLTNQDGRCGELLPESEDLSVGVYRLIFDVGKYFELQKMTTLYPVVEITFRIREGEAHFHLPLLLSPNGYTTYRGT